ncbi:MAG: very short patch repair endonuclease [Alphaproteobacteria bacterium]
MADTRTPQQRRRIMQSVGQRHTGPELVVRRVVHALGYRFRLHRRDLPGRPDVVLPRYKMAIFVNGCFWHGHSRCRKGRLPKSRREYWEPKIARNKERDAAAIRKLKGMGWSVLTVWQCQTRDGAALSSMLRTFLESNMSSLTVRKRLS